MVREPQDDKKQYSKAETQRRLESIMRGAFSGPPKPMKDIPRKRSKVQRKAKKSRE